MKTFTIATLLFCIGIGVGEAHRGKGTFFVSWYGQDLYYGEEVQVKKSDSGYGFYSLCKRMTIVGLQPIDSTNVVWVLLEGCAYKNGQPLFDTFNQDSLEAKK